VHAFIVGLAERGGHSSNRDKHWRSFLAAIVVPTISPHLSQMASLSGSVAMMLRMYAAAAQ
jgi:hypothetical protein